MKALSMNDVDMRGKTVAMRLDLNVPLKKGVIGSDSRIRAVLPTIQKALDAGAGVILLSHLGRPTEGEFDQAFSLQPVADRLVQLLGRPVMFSADIFGGINVAPGTVVLGENVRFLKGEEKNDPELARKLASLGDIYVMDAFGAAHRAHASTEGAIRAAKQAVAGPLMLAEMEAATKLLDNPARPLVAIIGGSKVSTKVIVLENMLGLVDGLIVGGGIANTFLAAKGVDMGKSLVEADFIPEAKRLIKLAEDRKVSLPLPVDLVVAPDLTTPSEAREVPAGEGKIEGKMALDIGSQTVKSLQSLLQSAKTVVWNGPVGAFETPPFDRASREIGDILAKCAAYTVVCGGDTVAAIEAFGLADKMDYLSTGGGAFLEVLEGKILPSVAALASRAG